MPKKVNLQFALMDDNGNIYSCSDEVKVTFENGECIIGFIESIDCENELEIECSRFDKNVYVDISDLISIEKL